MFDKYKHDKKALIECSHLHSGTLYIHTSHNFDFGFLFACWLILSLIFPLFRCSLLPSQLSKNIVIFRKKYTRPQRNICHPTTTTTPEIHYTNPPTPNLKTFFLKTSKNCRVTWIYAYPIDFFFCLLFRVISHKNPLYFSFLRFVSQQQ